MNINFIFYVNIIGSFNSLYYEKKIELLRQSTRLFESIDLVFFTQKKYNYLIHIIY